jgi:HD-GYP domain-containing protein (c-di-GMP phosphodiesterase class II)
VGIHRSGAGLSLRIRDLQTGNIRSRSNRRISQVNLAVEPSTARDLASAYILGGSDLLISRQVRLPGKALPTQQATKHRELKTGQRLLRALKHHDPYSWGHVTRVSMYVQSMAEAMGLERAKVRELTLAGRLHDMGKLGVSEYFLNGTRPSLTPAGLEAIHRHPDLGAAILEPIPSLRPLIAKIRAHHENLDGTGYPRKLTGGQISTGARILAVADAFDAMTSSRSYQHAMTPRQALQRLRDLAGVRYDPQIIDVLDTVLESSHRAREALRRGRSDDTHR